MSAGRAQTAALSWESKVPYRIGDAITGASLNGRLSIWRNRCVSRTVTRCEGEQFAHDITKTSPGSPIISLCLASDASPWCPKPKLTDWLTKGLQARMKDGWDTQSIRVLDEKSWSAIVTY
jgi:hypothetical protein